MKYTLKEYLTKADVEDIYATARLAHMGQKRRSGESYFTHPEEVASIVQQYYPNDQVAYLVALLHDTLEDAEAVGNVSLEELMQMISGSIADRAEYDKIISAVRELTHSKNVGYTDYLLSLASKPLALRVKLADMLHNLTSSPSQKQLSKYGTALDALEAQYSGSPPGISRDHMKALDNVMGECTVRYFVRNSLVASAKNSYTKDRGIVEMVNTYQSHTHEPEVGDMVVNTNPKCKHKGSEGIVLSINSLDDDSGKTIDYMCTNSGDEWDIGDVLEKTMDQLSPLVAGEQR